MVFILLEHFIETIAKFYQDFIVTSRTKIELFIKPACVLAIFIVCNLMIVPAIIFSYAVIIPIVLLWINEENISTNQIRGNLTIMVQFNINYIAKLTN